MCELIRKREQRKRELIVNKAQMTVLRCAPLSHLFGNVLDCLKEVDTQEIFADPVSLDDVPDYFDHIKKPMDMSTMRNKLDRYLQALFLRHTLVHHHISGNVLKN